MSRGRWRLRRQRLRRKDADVELSESDPEQLLIGVFYLLGRRHAKAEGREAEDILRERRKIINWLYPDLADSLEDADFLLSFRKWGLATARIEQLRSEASKRHRGRPVQQRGAAVAALREKLRNPERPFRQLTKEFCRCGRMEHDLGCEKNLLRQTRLIKNFLRRYKTKI
jgi:hypothetical protein